MAQFKLVMKRNRGNVVNTREIGSWEDHAREIFGTTRRKLVHNKDIHLNLTLVSPEGEILLEHNQ